jgi:tetratricopeptide (TPR) repeat protein
MLLVVFFASVGSLGTAESNTSGTDTDATIEFAAFQQAIEASDDVKATSIGESIFGQLDQKYKDDAGFGMLTSKLMAAKFLAGQMESHLRKALSKYSRLVDDELYGEKRLDNRKWQGSVYPAKSFYETSERLFSAPIAADGLEKQEKTFLAQYYDLQLRILTSAIAKAGQALAILDRNFKATHDYVLVLPLLHAIDDEPISIDVLPRWMQRPEQWDILSDSCLLHFGLPLQAMTIAKKSAHAQEKPFSEVEFYISAARRCGSSHPHIAADCLNKALDCVPNGNADTVVALRFDLVRLWLDQENYSLAAGNAAEVFQTYPNHKDAPEAIWQYYHALSMAGSTDGILARVDEVIEDKRCKAYKGGLMWLKWCALRRKRDETVRMQALELKLLTEYANDPMVAPILLSRATDLIALEDIRGASEVLTQLIERFPSTKSAVQARKMLGSLGR